MRAKSFILMTTFFLIFIPITVVANSAPDFDYTVDKAGVSADLLPYMTLFAGKWNRGPDFKMVINSFSEKKVTFTYSWSEWEDDKPGFKTREVKFNPKKKKFSYRSGSFKYYYKLEEKNGAYTISGIVVLPSNRRNYITFRPVKIEKE